MEKVLLKWSSNWADEMDVEGFDIMKKTEWEEFKKKVRKMKNFCVYIGTNEEIDYANGEDLLAEIKVKKISPEEERIIKKFVGSTFGFTSFLYVIEGYDENLIDGLDEEDDEVETI
jgi:hypothetical protein